MIKNLTIKRVYEEASKEDGYRILVDRIWPRGVSKEDAKLDKWWKEIAPSDETRKAFDHEPDKFETFEHNYTSELDKNEDTKLFIKEVDKELNNGPVTLLYGAKDKKYNQAVVLKKYLEKKGASTFNPRDEDFYQTIGKEGGEKTAETHDKTFYHDIGKKSGGATSDSHGKEFYEEIGKKGGKAPRDK